MYLENDIEYTQKNGKVYKDAIVNRLMQLLMDTLFSTPGGADWPVGENGVRPATMERIIGIESPSVNSADATAEYGSAYVNYAKKMLDGDAKTLSSVRLACCHLLARLIARERGYDKGQSDKAIGKAVIEGLIHKPIIYHDEKTDDDDIDVKVIDVKDPNWQKALYKVENELMLQSVMEEITDPTEKLVIRVYKEAQRTSLQEAFDWFSIQCSESGLNTLNSVSQRFTRLKTKYPELSKFNPFHD